jgi:hypothetical protein
MSPSLHLLAVASATFSMVTASAGEGTTGIAVRNTMPPLGWCTGWPQPKDASIKHSARDSPHHPSTPSGTHLMAKNEQVLRSASVVCEAVPQGCSISGQNELARSGRCLALALGEESARKLAGRRCWGRRDA